MQPNENQSALESYACPFIRTSGAMYPCVPLKVEQMHKERHNKCSDNSYGKDFIIYFVIKGVTQTRPDQCSSKQSAMSMNVTCPVVNHAGLNRMILKGRLLVVVFYSFFLLFFQPRSKLFAANRMQIDQVNHLWVCFHLKSLHLEKNNMANNISAMNLTTTYCVPLNKLMPQVLILFVAINKSYHAKTWWALGMQIENSACYNN